MSRKWITIILSSIFLITFLRVAVESVRLPEKGTHPMVKRHPGDHGKRDSGRILSRVQRQAEDSYEEYDYEDEGDEDYSGALEPEESEMEDDGSSSREERVEGDEENEDDEYYEFYDDSEEENERERERDEAREEEERRAEERREEQRREEQRQEEEDLRESARREEERKAEEEREAEERLEEERRQAEEDRRIAEERRRIEYHREEEEWRRQQYETSGEETEEESSGYDPYPTQEWTQGSDGEEVGVRSSTPPTESSEEEWKPEPTSSVEYYYDSYEPEGSKEERLDTSEPGNGQSSESTPIEESGREDLERYRVGSGSEEESRERSEYEESYENTVDRWDEKTETTGSPTPSSEEEQNEIDEELERSWNSAEDWPTNPSPTHSTERESFEEDEGEETPPERPYHPFHPSLMEEESEGRDESNEYEAESAPSSEYEIQRFPTDSYSTSPPETTPSWPDFPDMPYSPSSEGMGGRILGERERYHHQDLEIDEDEDDETELYEGRRFSAERRFNEGNRGEEERQPISFSSTSIPPLEPGIDDSSVTDLSREPDEERDEDSEEMESTSYPEESYESYESSYENEISPSTTLQPDSHASQNEFYDKNYSKEERDPSSVESPESPHLDPERNEAESGAESEESRVECFPGYISSPDGSECFDRNECEEGGCGPTQICTNLPGTYRCSCQPGFIKDFRNERVCRDLNECEIGNGGCSQDCVNTLGSFYCSCGEDFDLGSNKRTCIRRPTTTTTSTTTTTTTTTTTPPPPTTTRTTTRGPTPYPKIPYPEPVQPNVPTPPTPILPGNEESLIKNCPTPPVPRGAGIAYLYCSRSPVGIHHRHSQLERRLIQDWTERKRRGHNKHGNQNNLNTFSRSQLRRFRNRRNLRRRQRQTTYYPGSMCELRCRAGFELRGHYTLNCNATTGSWEGPTNGFCQALPKPDNQNLGNINVERTPSNEIPRLSQFPHNFGLDFISTKPTVRPVPQERVTSFRPIFHKPLREERPPMTPPPPASRFSSLAEAERYWAQSSYRIPLTTTTTTRRPYYQYYSPMSRRRTTTPSPVTTTSRNSYIQLTYRYKTPWIKCPDDIRIDLQPNQNLAYVIIPQPQTNVDWWRQVSAEPSWAKGLETEIGPGKRRITFRARTSAPINNTAECSFTLEIRDMDPPRVRECPESFTVRLNPGQGAKVVTWLEPHFSDNVRIVGMKKSHVPGTVMTLGEHLINYEAKDPSDNVARCSFTVTVLPSLSSNGNRFPYQNTHYRKPLNEGVTSPTTTTSSGRPEVYTSMRNVVCYVGKKGRRIVFLSRVVPRGCSEMTVDMVDESVVPGSYNTLNTISQNSAENMATSQISSVSYASHDTPQSASAFGQALSNGRNTNRMVHSTSSVTNGAHGTNSKSSSYAIAVSSSSRNFEVPFITDKQVYDEDDFVVPTVRPSIPKARSGAWPNNRHSSNHRHQTLTNGVGRRRSQAGRRQGLGATDLRSSDRRSSNNPDDSTVDNSKKYFRHFNSWGTSGSLRGT